MRVHVNLAAHSQDVAIVSIERFCHSALLAAVRPFAARIFLGPVLACCLRSGALSSAQHAAQAVSSPVARACWNASVQGQVSWSVVTRVPPVMVCTLRSLLRLLRLQAHGIGPVR